MRTEEFSSDQILKLRKLNKTLAGLEKKLKEQGGKIYTSDKDVIKNSKGWIQDYEIDYEISFYLMEEDPEYKEYEDNILATLNEPLERYLEPNCDFGICDGINHNEYRDRENHIFKDDFHCWLFHCLYHHTELEWNDLLRIGSIWTDIQVVYQNDIELN